MIMLSCAVRLQIGDKGTTRISFAMKLDQRYDTPPHQMIHFQVFQPKMAGRPSKVKNANPGGPILSLRTVPLSRRKDKSPDVQEFIIAVRNPQAENLYYFDQQNIFFLLLNDVPALFLLNH